MLQPVATRPQGADAKITRIGVGIDTSRYGHYAAFMGDDLNPAAAELQFVESGAGYAKLRERLVQISERHGRVEFVVRLDAAGQYADNLLHWLHSLTTPPADAGGSPGFALTLSCGDPQRNKNYRAALFGGKKSDPVEARAVARFALTERPTPTKPLSLELRILRQIAGRLQAAVRQRTRCINQLHHLVALSFPELGLLLDDLATGWVLELLHRFPTATLLASVSSDDLQSIPYLPHARIDELLEATRTSIASLTDAAMAELVRDQIRQLRDVTARQKRLESLLISTYRRQPTPNHLDSIPGIGAVTAAILTAFIVDIDRFATSNQLVGYFGVFPLQMSSGIDRDGQAKAAVRYAMCKRGNDLVRRYLWMAALSAVSFNPAVKALYARVVAKHPDRRAIAVGHAMRKLLHLAFAVWKTGKPFDEKKCDWNNPAQPRGAYSSKATQSDMVERKESQAAGLNLAEPKKQEVTANCTATVPKSTPVVNSTYIDFTHLKKQLPIVRVLEHLGIASRLKGVGSQQRCACPIHRGDGRGRTFSVELEQNVFHCFDAKCGAKGDVIDLWASLYHLNLRAAAIDLVHTFQLEPAPKPGTEKRHG